MIGRIGVAFLGTFLIITLAPSKAVQALIDIDFDTLTQQRPFKGEEFLTIEKQKLELPSSSPKVLIKYLKLWPSYFIPSINAINSEEHLQNFQQFFYSQCLPILQKDKLQEAKGCLAFACSIRPYEENAFKSFSSRAERCIKSLLFEKVNKLREVVDSEVLYWAWKHQEFFSDSFLPALVTWQDVLTRAANPKKASARAQYALGHLEEQSNRKGGSNSMQKALDWYIKAKSNGYQKAQIYLNYLNAKNSDVSDQIKFYEQVAEVKSLASPYPQYPYAQYIMGNWWMLSQQKGGQVNVHDQHVQRGFTYLQSAARYGIKEAQERLNQFRNQNKYIFYDLCNLSDQCENSQKRLEFLKKKAEQNLAPYAYQLAQMYEDGQGVPFETEKDWLLALEQAKLSYDCAHKSGIIDGSQDYQRIEEKIKSIKPLSGYFLKKMQELKKVHKRREKEKQIFPENFDPSHSLFVDISFISEMASKYAPRLKGDIIDLIQCILDASEESQIKLILSIFKKFSTTREFHENAQKLDTQDQEGGENQESKDADRKLQGWFEKIKNAAISDEYYSQLADNVDKLEKISFDQIRSFETNYAYRKIQEYQSKDKSKKTIFSPHHPLFGMISSFMAELSSCAPGVREAGIYLAQRSLDFEENSKLSCLLLDHLKELVLSEDFQVKALPIDELAENQAEKLIRSWGKVAEVTSQLNHLVRIKEVPEHLKVTDLFISDPRISMYNLIFREDINPFGLEEFKSAVSSLLTLYKQGVDTKKLTEEMCYNPDFNVCGTIDHLRDFLTNTKESSQDYSNIKASNRFGNRLIKIAQFLNDKSCDLDTVYAVLASWAAAGWHCDVRSETETYKFYIKSLQSNHQLPFMDDTIEMKVALVLADLRNQLFQKLIPQDENERIHQENYLEKKLKKSLGLIGDADQFSDPYQEKIINPCYKRMPVELLRNLVLKGNTNDTKYHYTTRKNQLQPYRVPISKEQGYLNPEILILHVMKAINDKSDPRINSSNLVDRFTLHYGKEDGVECMEEYYDDDYKMTYLGVKSLLYSFGYLEKVE